MNIKTICYDDIYEFCDMVDTEFQRRYYTARKNDSTVDIVIVAKHDNARKLINIFAAYDYEIANMDFHDPEYDGYEDEYIISLCYGLSDNGEMEIWCEPAKRKDDYLILGGDVVYILDECNSKITTSVESDEIYFVELEDEIENEYDEFMHDLECGNCNGDCESYSEYDTGDDEEYVNVKLSKEDAETLHKLYHIFGLLDHII